VVGSLPGYDLIVEFLLCCGWVIRMGEVFRARVPNLATSETASMTMISSCYDMCTDTHLV